VKYDQVLHGTRRQGLGTKGAKSLVTRKFLKKFIHYAHARTPRLSDDGEQEHRKENNYFLLRGGEVHFHVPQANAGPGWHLVGLTVQVHV